MCARQAAATEQWAVEAEVVHSIIGFLGEAYQHHQAMRTCAKIAHKSTMQAFAMDFEVGSIKAELQEMSQG